MAIEVGSKVPGKVTGITNFGAFVDLGDNQSGLVHISEIANHFVKDINDELTNGQEVVVKVLSIEDNGKIALSLKQAADENPASNQGRPERKAQEAEGRQNKAAFKPSQKNYGASPKKASRSNHKQSDDFDALMSSFLKDSEERLTSLKRSTEGKRGGRGGRRN